MRISDWSSDVCSSDLVANAQALGKTGARYGDLKRRLVFLVLALVVYRLGTHIPVPGINPDALADLFRQNQGGILGLFNMFSGGALSRFSIFALGIMPYIRSEEHTSELQSLMRISYAVFCLKKKKK